MVLVLYEDSLVRGGKPTNYGPHLLLAQCVADRLAVARPRPHGYLARDLIDRGLACNPRRGNTKLRDAVHANLEKHTRGGKNVVAVYDRDRIDEIVCVADPNCTRAIVEALAPVGGSDRLATVLLDANLETVITTLRGCGMRADLPWDEALAKRAGALGDRDRIMQNAAVADQAIRDRLLERMASFEYLVCKTTAAVMASRWFWDE